MCDVAQSLVVAPVVVVAGEGGQSCLEVSEHLAGDLAHVPLHGLVVALEVALGLTVKGRRQMCCKPGFGPSAGR